LKLDYGPTGYIQLAFPQFRSLTFPRRTAFEDHDLRRELINQAFPALSAGYCDWIDDTTAVQVCIGWAWFIAFGDRCQRLAPGGFSSNVMFTRRGGRPLGSVRTGRLLRAWLSTHPWQATLKCRGCQPSGWPGGRLN
jgi:hypothetical protein